MMATMLKKKPYSPDIRGFFHNHVTSMHSFAGDYQCWNIYSTVVSSSSPRLQQSYQ